MKFIPVADLANKLKIHREYIFKQVRNTERGKGKMKIGVDYIHEDNVRTVRRNIIKVRDNMTLEELKSFK